MSLRDILKQLIQDKSPILLRDSNKDWEASALLETLPDRMLNKNAHIQPGLYIAEMNEGGYLGSVLYKVTSKT